VSEIKKVKNKKIGGGRGRVREKANKEEKKMGEGEGQCMRGRRKNFLVALASINHSATWNGGERGRKNKMSPTFHFEES
jgi:hypothetical protein